MSDILNIPVRSIMDLKTIENIPLDFSVLDPIKFPVGNLPAGVSGEALTLNQIRELIVFQRDFARYIKTASGDNQQQINDRGGAKWYAKPGGYALNERVILDTGDIVLSLISENTNNPNNTPTGWFNESKLQRHLSIKINRDNETIYDFGAIGDGVLHTVEEWYTAGSVHYQFKYKGLADVQSDYPFVTDKDFSIDQAAILKLANLKSSKGGGSVDLSEGEFMLKPINDGACLTMPSKTTLKGRGNGTILHSVTNVQDLPTTTVFWDMVLFSGNGVVGGGANNFTVKHTGGRRNNTASIATRAGATRQKYKNINFESTIGSSIVIEYSVANPMPTFCRVSGITSKPKGRHSVYISGATHNTVTGSIIYLSALEGIAIRGDSRNTVKDNDFIGVEGNRAHAICLAQPPSGTRYKYYDLTVKDNRGHNLFGAGFYGQGSGCELYDSDVSGNNWELSVSDPSISDHHIMLYRTYRSNISNNVLRGGRNRGIMLYGCSKNDLIGNTVHNVVGSGVAAVGAVGLTTYKDTDDVTYNSSENNLIRNRLIDDRPIPLMKIGIQMFTGCVKNLVSKTEFEGIQTKIDSADGLAAQNIGIDTEKFLFTKQEMSSGTVAATDMFIGGNSTTEYVGKTAYVKEFRLIVKQLLISGTITVRLYKNGSALIANIFTADNLKRTEVINYQPGQFILEKGDTISVKIESNTITTSQPSIDSTAVVILAE